MTDYDVDMQARFDATKIQACGCGEPVYAPNLCEFCKEPMCSSCETWIMNVGHVCPKCNEEQNE